MTVVKLSVSDSGFQNGLGSSTVVEVTESVTGFPEPYEKSVATRKYVNQMLVMFSTGVKGPSDGNNGPLSKNIEYTSGKLFTIFYFVHRNATKGKATTAHCLLFLRNEWFHVWELSRQKSVYFSIRVKMKKGSAIKEVVVDTKNKIALTEDKFLRVTLGGNPFTTPKFGSFFLVTPRKCVVRDIENVHGRTCNAYVP
ncbi:hypothetical protein EJB05_50027, partial [Eragrostis curvula]